MHVALTLKSRNGKTGPIPVSTTISASCPQACPLSDGACYAKHGPLGMYWRKVDRKEAGASWKAFVSAIADLPGGQLWRHNQAGDLPGRGNRINFSQLRALVKANTGKRGFTYTHKPLTPTNMRIIAEANQNGFTINLSANNPAHADKLAELNIGPVVTVLPQDQTINTETPDGRKIVVCPATIRDNVSCRSCGLCQKQNRPIIGFPAHGVSKAKATKIAEEQQS